MDQHWTDHGNPKEHPHVPHDEYWVDNGKGGKELDPSTSHPSPEDTQKPTEPTDDSEFSLNISFPKVDAKSVIASVIGIGLCFFPWGHFPLKVQRLHKHRQYN